MKSIIFDFGGVLLNIDYSATETAFKKLGIVNFDQIYSQQLQEKLFDRFETGELSEIEFYEKIREISGLSLTDEAIMKAWNAMLINLPEENIKLLENLSAHFNIFLLSNTNIIHERAFTDIINQGYGMKRFLRLFNATYFSHHLGMRKPSKEIFDLVIDQNKLNKDTTLFLDDSPQHVSGAIRAGIPAKLVEKGKKTSEYISREDS